MKLLKWRNERRVSPQPINGAIGSDGGVRHNAITPEWRSRWHADACNFHETRRHVGRSTKGFHPGIEACYRAGAGHIEWGEARSSPERARMQSLQMENAWRERIAICNVHSDSFASAYCPCSNPHADVDFAFLDLRKIVARIEDDPAQDWAQCHRDFEQAVARLTQSIITLMISRGRALATE